MLSFFEADAHEGDPLWEHLRAVADRADSSLTGAPERVRRAAALMGLLHDTGKATPWFQDYLHERTGSSEHTNHSMFGAVLAHHVLWKGREEDVVSAWMHWTVISGIFRHHGNFGDDLEATLSTMKMRALDSEALRDQLDAFDDEDFQGWFEEEIEARGFGLPTPSMDTDSVLESLSSFLPTVERAPFGSQEDGFDFLAAFGAFVGADKMHTAHPDWEREAPDLPVDLVEMYKREEFGDPERSLDERREEIYQEVQERLQVGDENWIYTLTAPTGSGKTLTGLAAGLELKRRKEERGGDCRLVYCLPFTSVIDQNSGVYEDVLTENGIEADDRVLLKHHHLADPRYEEDGTPLVDGGELLVETWQSEIVVTTFYQLIHTFFTSQNKNLKRFAALRDAVVVLDEVQAIPHEHWEDARRAMKLCAERLGTTFLLMTATMPLIVDPEETPELLTSHPQRYEQLARTTLVPRLNEPMSVEELAEEIEADVLDDEGAERRIVLVNRRKTARRLYRRLETLPTRTAMLSTDLTPLDRERVLKDLGEEFLLITTQVIEAGVDISSDVLVRELAPLDSIIQSAGRCNREFENDRGRVEVVDIQEEGERLATPPYSSFLVQSTLEVLEEFGDGSPIDEARFHEMAQQYYRTVDGRSSSAAAADLLAEGEIHNLDDADEGLQLIESRPEQSHFIIQDEEDRRIWQKYLDIQNMEIYGRDDFLEKKRRFQEIKREFSKRLVNYPSRERPTDEVIPVEPDDDAYNSETGLRRNLAEASYAFI